MDLNPCQCCEGIEAATPAEIFNPPGLAALKVRAGTQASLKEAMLVGVTGQSALARLTTRDDDDPTIGIVDAWASALDVLTFYNERIANGAYVRSATERRSVLERAREIGYELGPGVAAGTPLAFTLEALAGAPDVVPIPVGVRAQSIPGPDEKPQLFETVEAIEARPEWNALRPKQRKSVPPYFGQTQTWLKGVEPSLRDGDALLFIGDERNNFAGSENWDFRRVQSVSVDSANDRTLVPWLPGLGTAATVHVEPAHKNPRVYALRTRAAFCGHNAPDPATILSPGELQLGFAQPKAELFMLQGNQQAQQLQQSADLPVLQAVVSGSGSGQVPATPDAAFPAGATQVNLDTSYPQITVGSWVVIASPLYHEVYKVMAAAEESVARYNLAGKTRLLTLQGEHLGGDVNFVNAAGQQVSTHFTPRNATVYGQSEELAYAEWDIPEAVTGDSVELDAAVDGLLPGRALAFNGKDAVSGAPVAEVVNIADNQPKGTVTTLHLASTLQHVYQRNSLTINANVAAATHGETRREVLGSGSAAKAHQAFVLKQVPLTYVSSAAVASGAASTLEIRVDGVLWHEVPTFYGAAPTDRIFTTRQADDGKVTVRFGDGINGARLPSGTENITATYRVGTGKQGMVKAAQVSLLLDRLLGLKEITNPTSPSGAEDPETRDRARANAPLTALTLERIVSLQDFEDFARAFAGIAKARATWLWDGQQRIVHLTVAAEGGAAIDPAAALFANLLQAIDAARDTHVPVRVSDYAPRHCGLKAKIKLDPDYLSDTVRGAVHAVLSGGFAFDARELGQALTGSEVMALALGVAGVVAVDLDQLDFLPGKKLVPRLPASLARKQGGLFVGAELLTLGADDIALTLMAE